jgi:hypothetical protein
MPHPYHVADVASRLHGRTADDAIEIDASRASFTVVDAPCGQCRAAARHAA